MYDDEIKRLAAAGLGHGRLEAPEGEALLDNPLCGDRVRVQVRLAGDRIEALAHDVKGCLLCRAAASVIGARAAGARIAELEAIERALATMLAAGGPPPEGWSELEVFAPVRAHRARHACVLLPFAAAAQALREAQSRR